MEKCVLCGAEFDKSDAASEYNSHFEGGLDYEEDFGGEVCSDCSISQSESNMNLGKAIDMWNGDEDMDEDVFNQHF